jgi:hypothetical protein
VDFTDSGRRADPFQRGGGSTAKERNMQQDERLYRAASGLRDALEAAGVKTDYRQVKLTMPMDDMRKVMDFYGLEKTHGIFEICRIQCRGLDPSTKEPSK